MSFSITSYASFIRKELLTFPTAGRLAEIEAEHVGLMDNLRKKSFVKKPADVFAYIFLSQLKIRDFASHPAAGNPPPVKRGWNSAVFLSRFLDEVSETDSLVEFRNIVANYRAMFPVFDNERLAELNPKNYSAYHSFLYLTDPSNSLNLFENLRALNSDPTGPRFRFRIFNYIWKYSKEENLFLINHLLAVLPLEYIESMRDTLVSGGRLQQQPFDFPEVRHFQSVVGHKPASSHSRTAGIGVYFNLLEISEELGGEYFQNLELPEIVWSESFSVRLMGCFYPLRNRIKLSLIFDNRYMPRDLIRYILYHEILHKYLGSRIINGRRYSHTPEFRRLEKLYPGSDENEAILTAILRNPALITKAGNSTQASTSQVKSLF